MSRGRQRDVQDPSPRERLEALVQQGVKVAKTARKHGKGLRGDNFYANKLAEIRSDATNAFRELVSVSAGDSSALAELLEACLAPSTDAQSRLEASRELAHALRTTWRTGPATAGSQQGDEIVPLGLMADANRGYLMTVARQMNGSFAQGWHDACAVMMRRLIEICIIEAFEGKGIPSRIQNSAGDYFDLSALVDRTLEEPSWKLSRNARRYLPQLRDIGHQSAHGRYFTARPEDIERVRGACRLVVEELLHIGGLLR
jgi:hypothetical protein